MAVTGGRIQAFRLRCSRPVATAGFYRQAFGCLDVAAWPDRMSLRLGEQVISIQPAATLACRPFAGHETGFQHLAIVVADMRIAMDRLSAVTGWTPISRHGPQALPATSGGATAFKFRDPEGHPLELLQFPPDAVPGHWQGAAGGATFFGIDHSAISVMDTARSAAFYTGLGFTMGRTQVNHGIEQARLDGLEGAVVEVTPLFLAAGGPPHLELLRYRHPMPQARPAADASAAASEVVIFMPERKQASKALDPDGHRLCCRLVKRSAISD